MQPIVAPLNVGDVLAGKYRVLGVLGSGGMAVVLAAKHLELGQKVAIKMLHPQLLTDATLAKRFVREGRNAVRIESEHVCRVTDVGRRDDGTPFLVMQYLEGSDLAKVSKTTGPLPIQDSVEYVVQACDAVAVAHSLGIVHRDLKPANLFLTRRVDGTPSVKVLDFGISKALVSEEAFEAGLTQTSSVVGSPRGMEMEALTSVWVSGSVAIGSCALGEDEGSGAAAGPACWMRWMRSISGAQREGPKGARSEASAATFGPRSSRARSRHLRITASSVSGISGRYSRTRMGGSFAMVSPSSAMLVAR